LLDATLDYLLDEADVRGFVPGPGWHHSTAHTADLLKFLARNRNLPTEDQGRILNATTKKFSTVGVYTFGEDEPLSLDRYTAVENMKGLLRALLVIVSADDSSESESAVRI